MTVPDDDRLLRLLGAAMAEAVPTALTEDARAVFTWRTVDAELLSLGFDSAVDELAGVRSPAAAARLLHFAAGDIEIEVDVVDGGLEGFVVGAEVDEVLLERPNGSAVTTEVGETGHFRIPEVPAGPVRLRVELAGGTHVTEWFLV